MKRLQNNKIALFLNRILYAIYEVWIFSTQLVYWFVDWTFGRLLYSIPFIRKRINEREGVTDYKSLSNKIKIPKSAFIHNELSIFIFVLPIFAVLNGVTIIISNPLKRLYTKSPVFIVLFISVFLISFFLDNYFFWNEDRYLTFFPSFKKEHIIKRLAWIVGTFAALVLLTVLNIKTFCYIINASK